MSCYAFPLGDTLCPTERKYTCPVCGNPDLEEPASNHNICACCRTQFDYSDYNRTHEELRADWIRSGMTWWSKRFPAPAGWSPSKQLENIGVANP